MTGVKVVDLEGSVASGYCGKLFADHGAQVINVEPAGGIVTRREPPFITGAAESEASALHCWLAGNKRSVVARGPDDIAAVKTLLRDADVVLIGGAAGHVDLAVGLKHGIVMNISWFGTDGPRVDWHGSDGVTHALTGMLRGIGTPEGPPLLPTGPQAQVIGGLAAYIACSGALVGYELGNLAGVLHLETSIIEANTCFTDVGTINAWNNAPLVPRLGINRFAPTFPLGVYPCLDGWIGLTVLTPPQWHSFCELIGMQEFALDEQYQTTIGRLEDADFLEMQFRPKLLQWRATELYERAQGLRVPLALVPTMEELLALPQYRDRGAFMPISHPDLPQFDGPATPFRLLRTPAVDHARVSPLGADQELLSL